MIGVYGGTFDPIHFGHLRTALELKTYFQLEQVRLIPCANPPHRTILTPAPLRLAMLHLALAKHPGLIADPCEIQRDKPSYTVDTLRYLKDTYQQTLLLFMGMDAFAKLETWYQWPQLFNYAHIVVITRPGFNLKPLNAWQQTHWVTEADTLKQYTHGKLLFHTVTALDISATHIRQLFFQQQDPRFLLPDSVIAFIHQHRLYQSA